MTTNATYKSFSNAVVDADIGLHVGLYGINVTLKGESLLLLLRAAMFIITDTLAAPMFLTTHIRKTIAQRYDREFSMHSNYSYLS